LYKNGLPEIGLGVSNGFYGLWVCLVTVGLKEILGLLGSYWTSA
jgi:hypothetical protein